MIATTTTVATDLDGPQSRQPFPVDKCFCTGRVVKPLAVAVFPAGEGEPTPIA